MTASLAHSPADVIRYLLVAGSQGTLPSAGGSWPAYCNSMPDQPDEAICIYDTAGVMDPADQQGNEEEHHGVTVVVRHASHDGGWTKANAVAIYLSETARNVTVTIGANTYIVYALTRRSRTEIREDGTKRYLFNTNAVVALRQTT